MTMSEGYTPWCLRSTGLHHGAFPAQGRPWYGSVSPARSAQGCAMVPSQHRAAPWCLLSTGPRPVTGLCRRPAQHRHAPLQGFCPTCPHPSEASHPSKALTVSHHIPPHFTASQRGPHAIPPHPSEALMPSHRIPPHPSASHRIPARPSCHPTTSHHIPARPSSQRGTAWSSWLSSTCERSAGVYGEQDGAVLHQKAAAQRTRLLLTRKHLASKLHTHPSARTSQHMLTPPWLPIGQQLLPAHLHTAVAADQLVALLCQVCPLHLVQHLGGRVLGQNCVEVPRVLAYMFFFGVCTWVLCKSFQVPHVVLPAACPCSSFLAGLRTHLPPACTERAHTQHKAHAHSGMQTHLRAVPTAAGSQSPQLLWAALAAGGTFCAQCCVGSLILPVERQPLPGHSWRQPRQPPLLGPPCLPASPLCM